MKTFLTLLVAALVAALVVAGAGLYYVATVLYPSLPEVDALSGYQPKEPLRIYAADGTQIAEYGLERRIPLSIDEFPRTLKLALLAAEDARFYEHNGVDLVGVARAALVNLADDSRAQGASTITMQLARNFYLSSAKTYARKLTEILLALKIEQTLDKDQILQLYMNQIYLGQRAYGFGAAARAYFGVDAHELTLSQSAMLAGLPKAPSSFNPISDPRRARVRQRYILDRMRALGYVSEDEYQEALRAPDYRPPAPAPRDGAGASVAEQVRRLLHEQQGDAIYESGLRVWTTIDLAEQRAAEAAVRRGLDAHTHRHPYSGPEAQGDPAALGLADAAPDAKAIARLLRERPVLPGAEAALVLTAAEDAVTVMRADGTTERIGKPGLAYARTASAARSVARAGIRPGAVLRLRAGGQGLEITAPAEAQAALAAVAPRDGAIRAMVGGNGADHLNRATQTWRQAGSAFKPFVYSAALARGMGPSTLVNDAPVELPSRKGVWKPKGNGVALGPIPLLEGVARSKNYVAIRVLQHVGVAYARQYVTEAFDFDPRRIPSNLPMALGAGEVTPLQLAGAYAVFANGGYKVKPYLISRIVDATGAETFRARPDVAGEGAPRAISAANAYLVTYLLRNAAQRGTGSATNALKRRDLAGKTGTTNDYRDGWFAGYQDELATVVWFGRDIPRSLGRLEYGSRNALPVWIDFMREALAGVRERPLQAPADIAVLGGVPYSVDHLPGHGFIDRVDVPAEPTDDAAGGPDEDWFQQLFR
ncbi:PBP1A family penicillin-binding protein [Achromobacter sp. Marseille-Q0513]|uniref:penicillin-binding protein 1A n=1 Tax=Achromobacter sp. Marseille-Q0513 TaxID=2829161 RepID=UPI001B996E4A|nr:PBP1A family penicillin-binding protein [Achromobacter sp. Marseille-Q0513]MBR8653968.1 PBP1A family penicillin-binding protein [Achromobacter sp. Marseille-Q0513]